MKSEIIAVFKKEEEIKKIIDKLKIFPFDEIKKHPHFEFSVMEKLTDMNKIRETFPKFNLVKSIELRENEKKQRYYSLNYELEDGTFVVIVTIFDREKPVIINGFHAKKNYKRFEKSLRKNYAKRFI